MKEHDLLWAKYLLELERALKHGASTDELANIYNNKKVCTLNEISEKIFSIYKNPKQENKMLGKRSKPKYVANKPGAGLIENRAINAQRNAKELLLHAQLIEAELNFFKTKLEGGLEVSASISEHQKYLPQEIIDQAKSTIEKIGLNWDDYKVFANSSSAHSENAKLNEDSVFVQKNMEH